DFTGAILMENDRITDIVKGKAPGAPEKAEIIDATGLIAAPGLIDMRVFTGEPGHEYRETTKSAGEAAAAGGVTSIPVMPDTQPVIDNGALVEFIARNAEANTGITVLPSAAITKGTEGKDLTEFGLLLEAGAACFTDGRKSLQNAAVIRAAMTY